MSVLLTLAIVFIVIAFVAWILGARGTAGFSWDVTKFLIMIFVILLVLSILVGTVLRIG